MNKHLTETIPLELAKRLAPLWGKPSPFNRYTKTATVTYADVIDRLMEKKLIITIIPKTNDRTDYREMTVNYWKASINSEYLEGHFTNWFTAADTAIEEAIKQIGPRHTSDIYQ